MSEKISPVFYGVVRAGKIVLDTEVLKKRFMDRLRALEGKKVELIVKKYTKRRSLNQNNYYWGAIIPMIADYTGMIDEEVHEAMRLMFLKDKSKKLETVKSTSELSKGEFAEYLVDIQNWAIPFFNIEKWPDPEEWTIINL